MDSRGIPGWDKVDDLAKALIGLSGLSVTNSQAKEIKRLYLNLLEFDKRPLMFKSGPYRPPKRRFGRAKRLGGHVNVDSMKRYFISPSIYDRYIIWVHIHRCFLSAGSPASSPAKSRLVEAICILLCAQYPQPRRERGQRPRYTSRWKLVLSAYNAIRARLLNSQALLEETNLVLYTINETTLVSTGCQN